MGAPGEFKKTPGVGLVLLHEFGNLFHATADLEVRHVIHSAGERRLARDDRQEHWISIINTQIARMSFCFDSLDIEKHSRILS
jgi:hypothetical protein